MGFPKLVRGARTPVRVVIESELPNEFGEKGMVLDASFLCNYQSSGLYRYTADKQGPEITGVVLIDGDILPSADVITSGYVVIFGKERQIVKGTKARNLDGTVNYTRLDVA